jgi:hypothetical protein
MVGMIAIITMTITITMIVTIMIAVRTFMAPDRVQAMEVPEVTMGALVIQVPEVTMGALVIQVPGVTKAALAIQVPVEVPSPVTRTVMVITHRHHPSRVRHRK